ncbi:MAG: hypothetical protein NW216_01370 [Hyphomicrobium sp.]|nr:hypothetical protein [Hyphomicrobium sp.]
MLMRGVAIIVLGASLCACSGGGGVTTGSLFGSQGMGAAPSDAGPKNDPTSRAFQVGSVAARAVKCGYNFDPQRLRSSFIAAEAATGATPDMSQVERTYDVSYNAVAKAIAAEPDYCTAERTADIKSSLSRHLAGDFTPSVPKRVAQPQDNGWFNWGGSGEDNGPSFGSEDWWEKQKDAIGS